MPPLPSAIGKTGLLTDKPTHRIDAYRLIRRRAADAGFQVKLGCHVFRATGITAYLETGGTLETMAAHESPRTTNSTTELTYPQLRDDDELALITLDVQR